MLRRYFVQAINNERKLERHRLLGPHGSIVIEDRDPILGFDELRVASVVTLRTKFTMLCFVGPSFQEGRGAPTWAYSWNANNANVVEFMGVVMIVELIVRTSKPTVLTKFCKG